MWYNIATNRTYVFDLEKIFAGGSAKVFILTQNAVFGRNHTASNGDLQWSQKGNTLLEFIKKYWLEVLFGVLTANCASLFSSLKKRKKENLCLKSAICALLRDRIIVIYNRYSEREYFPIHERENLSHLTAEYYALGGNGVVHELCEKLSALPTEKPAVSFDNECAKTTEKHKTQ